MRKGALPRAVRFSQVGEVKQPSVAPLPISDRGLRFAVAGPEKVARIGSGSRRDGPEHLRDRGRQRHVNGGSSFRLVKENAVAHQSRSFERDRVTNAKTTPSHQKGKRPEPSSIAIALLPSVLAVKVSSVDYLRELVFREVICRGGIHRDLSQSLRGIGTQPTRPDAEPKEADQPLLFFSLRKRAVFPGGAVVAELGKINFL